MNGKTSIGRAATQGTSRVHVFGVRHHGPGSAASLVAALEALRPDAVLLEGPPDADGLIHFCAHGQMQPPVALLVYPSDLGESREPLGARESALYPFATFSPEWNAMRYGLREGVPVRFIDLPQTHQMALGLASGGGVDALALLAEAAGCEDGETWWEMLVEQRTGADVFPGILEAMAAVRAGTGLSEREALREAWMRRCVRHAQKEGRQRIAVVCGAWHAPVLVPEAWPKAARDEKLLKGLPKRKVECTWVPWTYDRLSFAHGYGAGVESPEYYHLLWEGGDTVVRWMVEAARLLRAADLAGSPASAVEGVRLAHTLAALRGRIHPGLAELEEAARSVYCHASDAPMRLIRRKLVLGERLGVVPPHTPQVPLAKDLAAQQKRLRLPPEASHRDVDLDLRKPHDRERSLLIHRLLLLDIEWGKSGSARGLGTFRESWRLQWRPEFALELVQAARWGNTVREAACARTLQRAARMQELAGLTDLCDRVLLGDLPEALAEVLQELQARAALASDPAEMLAALPSFARILRYPDVRQTDSRMLTQVVEGLLARICIGLPLACASLNDEAAQAMFLQLQPAHSALLTSDRPDWLERWRATLVALADHRSLHGLLGGRAVWLLRDLGHFDPGQASRRLGLALSRAVEPEYAAAWLEGFLRDNGELLRYERDLFELVDEWLCGLEAERFTQVLPLVRRTFATFPPPVRRSLGETLQSAKPTRAEAGWDEGALVVVPTLRILLGLPA